MTHPLAALIAGVPRYNLTQLGPIEGGQWLNIVDVLAALEAAPVPDLVEAGKVLEGVTPGPWTAQVFSEEDEDASWFEVLGPPDSDDWRPVLATVDDGSDARFIAWCREGVPALIALAQAQAAQIAGLEAERDQARAELALADAGMTTRAEAAEAKVAELEARCEVLHSALSEASKTIVAAEAKVALASEELSLIAVMGYSDDPKAAANIARLAVERAAKARAALEGKA